jgi:hypothetical protein
VSRIALVLAVCGLAAGAASAATSPVASLEKTLKADMVKTFKKQAPKLVIETVTCALPKDGVTAHCKATFEDGTVKGYYPVTAKIEQSGDIKWTAQSPKCLYGKKYTAC